MKSKIDPKELAEIVEETARAQTRGDNALEPEQARQVLQELGLPPEQMEAARASVVARREENRRRARRNALLVATAVGAAGLVAVLGWRSWSGQRALAAMTAAQSQVTLEGRPLGTKAARASAPELSFEVLLAHAPLGTSVELGCDWLSPAGDVRYQNHWRTKDIDKAAWPTHCRRRFSAVDAPGTWTVRMKAGERLLASQSFELE